MQKKKKKNRLNRRQYPESVSLWYSLYAQCEIMCANKNKSDQTNWALGAKEVSTVFA